MGRAVAPTVIVHGPQGCGKTRNAQALRQHFGCTAVRDEGDECNHRGPMALQPGALHLMCELPRSVPAGVRVVPFDEAMRQVRGR